MAQGFQGVHHNGVSCHWQDRVRVKLAWELRQELDFPGLVVQQACPATRLVIWQVGRQAWAIWPLSLAGISSWGSSQTKDRAPFRTHPHTKTSKEHSHHRLVVDKDNGGKVLCRHSCQDQVRSLRSNSPLRSLKREHHSRERGRDRQAHSKIHHREVRNKEHKVRLRHLGEAVRFKANSHCRHRTGSKDKYRSTRSSGVTSRASSRSSRCLRSSRCSSSCQMGSGGHSSSSEAALPCSRCSARARIQTLE